MMTLTVPKLKGRLKWLDPLEPLVFYDNTPEEWPSVKGKINGLKVRTGEQPSISTPPETDEEWEEWINALLDSEEATICDDPDPTVEEDRDGTVASPSEQRGLLGETVSSEEHSKAVDNSEDDITFIEVEVL